MKHNKLYWPPAVTTDVVIFTIHDEELKILLINRPEAPFKGSWALPGGFLQKDESSEHGALRVLQDKAGISNVYMEQLYTFDSEKRDPRGHTLTIAYFALVAPEKLDLNPSKSLQTPTLFSVKKLPSLAFDHKEIITYAIKRLQSKLEYTNVVYSLLPRYFTFYQLQKAYETILGKKLDKRNFRKKFMILKLIKPTNKKLTGTRQRPAQLYQFISTKPSELKKFF